MQILFAITVFCCLALVFAAVAFTRHIRFCLTRRPMSSNHPTFADYLLTARKETPSRSMRSFPTQTVQQIIQNKNWNQPPELVTVRPGEIPRRITNPPISNLAEGQERERNSLQRWYRADRLDWAYFNEDFGDLSDPYQTPRPRANSGHTAASFTRR